MTDQPINPVEQPKKGMSTGLKVTLIVLGAIIVLIVAAVIYCVANKEKLVVAGTKMMVQGMKSELAQNPVEGVDADRYNRVADAFLVKVDEPDQDFQQVAVFAQQAGEIVQSKPYTAEKVERLIQAMIQMYPDLAEVAGPRMEMEEVDTTMTADSTMMEEETTVDE